jgi:hypothetical protein
MQIRTLRTLSFLAGLVSAAGGAGCGSSPSSTASDSGASSTAIDPTAFGLKYEIADNQILGWTEDPTAYWTGTDLIASGIDGGNMAYDDRGFRQGMFETLNGPDLKACDLRAMDFGTDANATTMFTYSQMHNSATVAIPPFGASIAIGETVLGGVSVFAHFKASYFEVAMTGYADQASAISDAALFLQAFQTDAN